MADNIIQNDVTYSFLIEKAAELLYSKIRNTGVDPGTFRTNKASFRLNIGGGRTQSVTLTETERRSETYVPPTQDKIKREITSFMDTIGIPTGNTVPTNDSLISFFFALNYFLEKALINRAITGEENSITYHIHYQTPSASAYKKLNYTYPMENSISEDKITAIYNQLKETNLLADGVRRVALSSSAHTSSSSSISSSSSSFISRCSCSSIYSSMFIAFFNLG